MGRRSPQELLAELRTYLQHFEQTGHLGESESVPEIVQRLRIRIAEAEAEAKRSESRTQRTIDTTKLDKKL